MTPDGPSFHFADDEEQLGRFVLGRLNEVDRGAAEKHLATCSYCREAVRREKLIAAGGKHLGRTSLKSSLSGRIEARGRSFRAWPRYASVAAIVVLLVGAAIYSRIFWPKMPAPAETQNPATPAPTAENRPLDKIPMKTVPERSARERGTISEFHSESPVPAGKAGASGGGAARIDRNERVRKEEASSSYWIVGEPIIETESTSDELAARGLAAKKSNQMNAAQAEEISATQYRARAIYHILRRSLSELPAEHPRSQLHGGITASVSLRGDTTLLTLYVDSLAASLDTSSVRATPAGEDSVIVRLGSRLVGFHLRPDTSQKAASKKGK
jgi:hypothetical protein